MKWNGIALIYLHYFQPHFGDIFIAIGQYVLILIDFNWMWISFGEFRHFFSLISLAHCYTGTQCNVQQLFADKLHCSRFILSAFFCCKIPAFLNCSNVNCSHKGIAVQISVGTRDKYESKAKQSKAIIT